MDRKWIVVTVAVLAALAGWPGWLAAQRQPRPPRPPRSWAYSFSTDRRGRIGVIVNTAADVEADKLGARIEAVTPGGPAAKAGLKAGDIITKFNQTSLAGVEAEDRDESGPGMKLIELAHALDPGDTVAVEYRRGGEAKKATLVAEDIGSSMGRMEIPEPRIFMTPPGPGRTFEFSFGMPWGDLDLVSLNPDLGEYFGTREGILVVRAAEDTTLPLKAGDVILSIGGRKPTSPSHAMRILRSYDEGETVSIEIMRKQKRTTISWKVPKAKNRMDRFRWRQRDHQDREDDNQPG